MQNAETGERGIPPVKQLLHWGDTYAIDIVNPADELMGLLVIAIDAANCTHGN